MPEGVFARLPPALWYLLGALAYLSFGFTEMMGSDLWWHMAAGRELFTQESLALTDRWSFTAAGQPWHNHEWLADLIFYGWVELWGVPSLVIWKWLLIIATFTLFQRVLRRLAGEPTAALLASVAAAAIAAPFLDMRPQLYTLLAVAVLLNLALHRRPRWWELALLFLLWVNLHGGFIFGLMLLPILLFPGWKAGGAAWGQAVRLLLLSAAVCLFNPDGFGVVRLPLEYALDRDSPYRAIAEWRSPFVDGGIRSPLFLYSLVVAAALLASLVLPRLRRQLPCLGTALLLALLTLAMAVTSRRFIILWALGFALLLAPFLALLLKTTLLRRVTPVLLLAVLVLAVVRLAPYSLRPAVAYHYLTAEYAYPEGLLDLAEQNGLRGDTFALYNWGGYIHWRSDGNLRVFIDGRANTVYNDQTYLDYITVLHQRPGWQAVVEASGAKLFLWPRSRGGGQLMRALVATGAWKMIYQDSRGALLAHESLPLPPTLRIPRDSVGAKLADVFVNFRQGRYEQALVYARAAHEQRPWGRGSCLWLKRSLESVNRRAEAGEVMADCRGWFSSRYLR